MQIIHLPNHIIYPLLLCALVGTLMTFISRFQYATLSPLLVDKAGLAMELANDPGEMVAILGWKGSELGDSNYFTMKWVQYLDFVFIAGYTSFFSLWALSFTKAMPTGVRLLGWVVLICILTTALLDILENVAILTALSDRSAMLTFWRGAGIRVWPIRRFGVAKWTAFLFSTLAFGALLFFAYMRCSSMIAGATISLALSSAVGLFAIVLGQYRVLASSFSCVLLALALVVLAVGLGNAYPPDWVHIKGIIEGAFRCRP